VVWLLWQRLQGSVLWTPLRRVEVPAEVHRWEVTVRRGGHQAQAVPLLPHLPVQLQRLPWLSGTPHPCLPYRAGQPSHPRAPALQAGHPGASPTWGHPQVGHVQWRGPLHLLRLRLLAASSCLLAGPLSVVAACPLVLLACCWQVPGQAASMGQQLHLLTLALGLMGPPCWVRAQGHWGRPACLPPSPHRLHC
jgi:hypothetical protein